MYLNTYAHNALRWWHAQHSYQMSATQTRTVHPHVMHRVVAVPLQDIVPVSIIAVGAVAMPDVQHHAWRIRYVRGADERREALTKTSDVLRHSGRHLRANAEQ